jgi:hypothetical protein
LALWEFGSAALAASSGSRPSAALDREPTGGIADRPGLAAVASSVAGSTELFQLLLEHRQEEIAEIGWDSAVAVATSGAGASPAAVSSAASRGGH